MISPQPCTVPLSPAVADTAGALGLTGHASVHADSPPALRRPRTRTPSPCLEVGRRLRRSRAAEKGKQRPSKHRPHPFGLPAPLGLHAPRPPAPASMPPDLSTLDLRTPGGSAHPPIWQPAFQKGCGL